MKTSTLIPNRHLASPLRIAMMTDPYLPEVNGLLVPCNDTDAFFEQLTWVTIMEELKKCVARYCDFTGRNACLD
jgi:hypothetical protein